MARRLAEGVGTVWVHAKGSEVDMVSFSEGDEVPSWAAEQMGDHCFEADADDTEQARAAGYYEDPEHPGVFYYFDGDTWPNGEPGDGSSASASTDSTQEAGGYTGNKGQLQAEIDQRNASRPPELQIEPEGKNKPDLVAALEADDKDGASSWDDLTIEQLNEVIAARNEDREDDDKIVVEGDGNKPDIVAALTADDEA